MCHDDTEDRHTCISILRIRIEIDL